MKRALALITAWRNYIEHDAIEHGFIKPKGSQNQGHRDGLEGSRVAECSVYSGRTIPVHPGYLTVELHIKMLNLGEAEKPFKKFLFRRLRTQKSLLSANIGRYNRENAERLLDSLMGKKNVEPTI